MIRLARIGVLAAAVFVLALIALSVPAQAIAPAVAIVLGMFAGAAITAVLLSVLKGTAQKLDAARQQYAQDVRTYTATVEQIYNEHLRDSLLQIRDMHNMLFNKTFSYYVRWAESIASSKCTRTNTITYQDLGPVMQDLAQMYANYVQQVLNLFINAYQNQVAVAQMRHGAGIGDTATIIVGTDNYIVYYDGNMTVWFDRDLGPFKYASVVIVASDGEYVIASGSTSGISVDQSAIKSLLDPMRSITNIYFALNGTLSSTRRQPDPIIDVLRTINDARYIAAGALSNAQVYCNLVFSNAAAANLPPPSVALPFDLNTYNQLSYEDRYALYIAYLNRLAQTNWSQVSSVLPRDVYISNTSGRIYGCVYLDLASSTCANYTVVPVTPTISINFAVGGYAPLAGTYALVDPSTGRIVNIINPSPLPVPQNYTILWRSADGRQALIQWTDPSTGRTYQGVAVDTSGDGVYDAVYPYIQPSQIYQRDPKTGNVSNVNNITIGPTPTDQWAQNYGLSSPKPLSFLGGLSGVPRWALYAAIGFGALLLLIVALRR